MAHRDDLYKSLFQGSADAMLIIEEGEFVDCNQAALNMLRMRSKEQLYSTHPSKLSPPTQQDGQNSFQKSQ